MVNGTLLKFVKRYEDDLGVIFDQWPKFLLLQHASKSDELPIKNNKIIVSIAGKIISFHLCTFLPCEYSCIT